VTRFGFIAVIGPPNSGKSTLVNALADAKVAIVSPKVQTTRLAVRGIVIKDQSQIVFVDTPGIFRPRRNLDRAMIRAAWGSTEGADGVLLIVDSADLIAEPAGAAAREAQEIMETLQRSEKPAALLLNKIDKVKRPLLLPLAERLNAHSRFDAVFMISAAKKDGLASVLGWCSAHVPEGEWLYPADQAADVPLRLLVAELTREKVYLRLHDELPYATSVRTTDWKERKDGSVRIEQIITVQREGQKAIVLGKGGATIKAIGEQARRDAEEVIGKRVHLFLRVEVDATWDEARERYVELGLEYPGK